MKKIKNIYGISKQYKPWETNIIFFYVTDGKKSKNIMLIMSLNSYASTKLNIAEREWSDSKAFKLDVHREEYF